MNLTQFRTNKNTAITEFKKACADMFALDQALLDAIKRLEEYKGEYRFDRNGELRHSVDIGHLLNSLENDEIDALGDYLCECYHMDTVDQTLSSYCGNDAISIQSDTRQDNGVWQYGKLVITEDKYTVDGDIDENLRNELIEKHMEKTGVFPEVIEVGRDCNVTLINTNKKG